MIQLSQPQALPEPKDAATFFAQSDDLKALGNGELRRTKKAVDAVFRGEAAQVADQNLDAAFMPESSGKPGQNGRAEPSGPTYRPEVEELDQR